MEAPFALCGQGLQNLHDLCLQLEQLGVSVRSWVVPHSQVREADALARQTLIRNRT